MGSFSNKVVLITGAAGGIGIATAKAFAEEGAKLALVDLKQEALEKAVKEAGINDALLLTADVTNEEQVKKYVDDTVKKYGSIDSFVNNAGINGDFANIVDQTITNFKNVLNVNVIGVFLGLKYVMKVMIDQKQSSIVNLASNGGLLGAPGMSAYVASKHAVIALNKTAALEGAQYGIRSVAVCPSGVDTQMMRSIERNALPGREEEAKTAFAASVPMNRYAEAYEIANLITFLASEKASFISGSYYRIDGGQGATSV
jgi:3-hydroxybutyrate dehydrogenase